MLSNLKIINMKKNSNLSKNLQTQSKNNPKSNQLEKSKQPNLKSSNPF